MYRKGTSALIANNKNEFLLVNLESFQEKYFAIPGGGIETNETLEESVYREIFEELNISKDQLELVGKSEDPLRITFKTIKIHRDGNEYLGSDRYFFGLRFMGEDSQISPLEGEVRSYKWSSIKNFEKYLLFENQRENTLEKIYEIFPTLKTLSC